MLFYGDGQGVMQMKTYTLLGANGVKYESEVKGEFGGNSKLKIYGQLDCGTALAAIRRFGISSTSKRVFFADEKTALAAGYRPCGNCLRKKYREYMQNPDAYRAKFGL